MTSRKSVFVEAYTHGIADLAAPARSLVVQVVVSGWLKLLIPGPVKPDRVFASAPKEVELFDLKADPLETTNIAEKLPHEVKRLQAIQNGAWLPASDTRRP